MASERDETARKKFRKLTGAFESGHYIFLDEMGSNLGLTRQYGRAAPGERVRDEVPGERGGNLSTIGAIGLDGIRTGLSVPGAIDGETMLFFVVMSYPSCKRRVWTGAATAVSNAVTNTITNRRRNSHVKEDSTE